MDLKLCFALLILCSSFLYKGHGRSFKDNKRKPNALNLKTKLRQKIFHHHHHRYHYRHHHKHYPHHNRRHHDKQNKPHHHHHHHPYHDHHHDQHHHHHRYHHSHHHQQYPHHHRRHHDKQKNPHYHNHHHPYHDHHHNHRHHHHYHNPIKHYIYHSHQNLYKQHHHHHHPRYHPHNHHLRVHHKKTLLHEPIQRNHQDQPRSHINQPPVNAVSNSLKVHVKINNDQAVKRQSLPELLSNLGQNLMTLGKNMTIKTPAASASSSAIAGNSDKKGDIMHGIPMPQFSFDAEGLSSTAAVIPTHSRGKNITATDLEALLHKALDRASGDDIRGGTASGGGEDMEDEDEEKEDINMSFPPKASESPQHQHLSFHESADKRNETYVDYPKKRRLPESSEHFESDRQSANYNRADFAKEFMQRERSADKNDVEKKSEPFHGNLLKGAGPKKSNLTDSEDAFMANETSAANIRDNDFQGESNKIKAKSLFDGPRSPDMNSKFEDTDVTNGGETANPNVENSWMTVTGENKSRKRTKEQAEAPGSGDQLDEETRLRGDASKDESSDISVLDEDYGSGENSGQYVNENAQSPENDQERYHNKMAKQDNIIQESTNAISGDKIDGKTDVNNAENYKQANLNEARFEKDREDSLRSDEAVDANASKSKLANKAGIDAPEIKGEHLDQGSTVENLNEDSREDFDPSRTQSVSSYPETAISRKDDGKLYNVPDEQTNFQDFQRNQLGNPGQPVINATDDNSGENTIVQETMEESSRAQEQGTLSDNTSFIDAPPSTNDINSAGMNTEGTQLSDLYGVSSRENTTVDDDSDEIPVYMLSSPSSTKDSFNGEESTVSPIFTAPTSSLSTSSSFSYSEPSTLTLGDGSFSSIDDPSEGDQSTFPRERIGFQKDMLDDPVEESLDAAVDTSRSNVAVAHETVADS